MPDNPTPGKLFSDFHDAASRAHELRTELESLIKNNAAENDVLARLSETPDAVLAHLHNFGCLPIAGLHKAYAYVLSRQGHEDGIPPEKQAEFDIGNFRIALDGISGDYGRGMDRHRGDPARQDRMREDALKGVDMLLEEAAKAGCTSPGKLIDLHIFAAHHNFDLLPGLTARGADLAGTLRYLQRRASDNDQYAPGPLHVLEDYAVVSEDGKIPVKISYEFNARALHAEAEKRLAPFLAALEAGDDVTAEKLLLAADIRQTQALRLIGPVIEHADRLLPVLLDHARIGNMAAFATHVIQQQLSGSFANEGRTAAEETAHRQKALRGLDALLARGGDINGILGEFLVRAAQYGGPEVIPELVQRGAKPKKALKYAREYSMYGDDCGYSSGPSAYPQAIRNLEDYLAQRKATRAGNRPKPPKP